MELLLRARRMRALRKADGRKAYVMEAQPLLFSWDGKDMRFLLNHMEPLSDPFTIHRAPAEVFEEDCAAIAKQSYESESREVSVNEPSQAPNTLLFVAALVCSLEQRDALVGDLTERYGKACLTWGPRKAKLLLVRDILGGLGPSAGGLARKLFSGTLKVLGLKAVYKIFFG